MFFFDSQCIYNLPPVSVKLDTVKLDCVTKYSDSILKQRQRCTVIDIRLDKQDIGASITNEVRIFVRVLELLAKPSVL